MAMSTGMPAGESRSGSVPKYTWQMPRHALSVDTPMRTSQVPERGTGGSFSVMS